MHSDIQENRAAQQKRITVFTPTYNRKHVLPKLYESLCWQDYKDFTWLIIDDGSTDGTSSLVSQWMDEGKLDICYHRQENGGKMRAHNRGVELCSTTLFVCVDSDDWLASPTVLTDTLAFWDDNGEITSRDDISGMVSYRRMVSIDAGTFPEGLRVTKLGTINSSGYHGETTLVFKTNVLRRFPFPVIEGEKFITEDIVYDLMDQTYSLLVFPYYSQVCEYLPDGLSHNSWSLLFGNPKGYRTYYNQKIKLRRGGVCHNMRMYIACSLIAGDGRLFAASDFKLLTLLSLPMGIYQYFRLKRHKW